MARRADCFASFEEGTDAQLLADWRWLIGADEFKVIRVTAFGNLFLRDSEGRVHLLDTTRGWIREVAASEQEWMRCLDDVGHRRLWLLPFVVELLRRDGVLLKPGQCYSWKHPPHLGGEMAADNAEPCDIMVHVSVLGQLHRQIAGQSDESVDDAPPARDGE
jgi:hypothetical protein